MKSLFLLSVEYITNNNIKYEKSNVNYVCNEYIDLYIKNDKDWIKVMDYLYDDLNNYKIYHDIVFYLMKNDINNNWNLINASLNGQLNTIKYLINETDANVNYKRNIALYFASRNGHLDIVKYLITVGVNISDAALHIAYEKMHTNVVEFLLEFYKHRTNEENINSLIRAVRYNYLDIVKYLIKECEINIHANQYCISGANICMSIANDKGYNEIIKLLKN